MSDTAAPALVIKIGGTVAADTTATAGLLQEIASLEQPVVLVHGGGKTVTAVSRRLGFEPVFRDGIRITTPAEMDVVDMVLAGQVNTALVRLSHSQGLPAVGLTGADGGLLTGRVIAPEGPDSTATRTARPLHVDPAVLLHLFDGGFLPVVASVGTGEDGGAVNINADDAAQAIAEHLPGATLCYLSDTVGVLDDEGRLIRSVEPRLVEQLIADGVVRDGMAAKLRSCAGALAAGVERVMIARHQAIGDLARVLAGNAGTVIRPDTPTETAGKEQR